MAKNGKYLSPKPTPRRKWPMVVIGVLLLIVIVLAAALLLGKEDQAQDAQGFFDENAQFGNLPGRSQEEILAELNKIVEEGMFNISISSQVVVDSGDHARVCIENIAANHHNMQVTITLDDTGEVIYESAGLKPGQYIEFDTLNRKLDAGEYNATAVFTAHDLEDLSEQGKAAAKILIVVP